MGCLQQVPLFLYRAQFKMMTDNAGLKQPATNARLFATGNPNSTICGVTVLLLVVADAAYPIQEWLVILVMSTECTSTNA